MSCMWIPVVTMGYSIESLDVCFGNQLVDSRDLGESRHMGWYMFSSSFL